MNNVTVIESFEEIVTLTDEVAQAALHLVENADLEHAMSMASPTARAKILGVLSINAGIFLEENVEALGHVSSEAIVAAQRRIVAALNDVLSGTQGITKPKIAIYRAS